MEESQTNNKNLTSNQNPQKLVPNDVVQINPESQLGDQNGFFAGCLMVVTEVKEWGVQGYISSPKGRGEMPGQAYYRAKWDQVLLVGKAHWVAG